MLKSHMKRSIHYNDVIMGPMASQIISLTSFYSSIYSGADQRKHQSSASLPFVWGIHRGPANSPHKWPVTWKTFPFDDVFMIIPEKKIVFVLMTSAMTSQRDFKHCPLYPCQSDCCSRSKFQGQYLTLS